MIKRVQPLFGPGGERPTPEGPCGGGGFAFNMSAPPRSRVRVGSGIEHRSGVYFDLTGADVPSDLGADAGVLAAFVGVEAGEDAEAALERATIEVLESAKAPAAAVGVVAAPESVHRVLTAPCPNRLLAVAVLSRTSGNLFLRARSPRFSPSTLRRAVLFLDDALGRSAGGVE